MKIPSLKQSHLKQNPLKNILAEFSFDSLSSLKINYRHLAFLATVLTGLASLCAQVAWQKYLTILVGSETRSISLVIAVFLLGLAVGYFVFGKITEKEWDRYYLLKFYGWVEVVTAIYIFCFYLYFEFLKSLSFNSPAHFLIDILIAVLALFFPTFLMGASIPVLTSTLPNKSEEINPAHVQIYGWNTLGAFLGVLLSGFYFLPVFGLNMTLLIAGTINFIAGLIFIGNNLEGTLHRQKSLLKSIPTKMPTGFFLLFTFITGSIIISFEVLLIRLLNLTIGAGVYNFPIILSLFVGGLALGSLSVKADKITARFFIRQTLISSVLLGILFLLSPYWSIWISHIRVSMLSISSNYFAFQGIIYLFVFIMLFPAVFFMGRLLPLTYALLKKDENNYGKLCGYVYFFNTLGTVFGTIFIGYLAFYFFNLDDLFKINLILLTALALIAAFYEKRALSLIFSLALLGSFFCLPAWDRTGHELGYFRTKTPRDYHFKKLFSIPKGHKANVIFFKDGPNASMSLLEYDSSKFSPEAKKLFPSAKSPSVSFVVNAKAIGNSFGDFSTVFLISTLGYLYAPERSEGLSSAVIGLGMGISAGALAKVKETKDLTVLEIAPEVIETVKRSPSFSFDLMSNPKAQIIAQDGFKYFTKTKKKFDVIVSEPSNPWVVGVENVFSQEFYEIAKQSLEEDGVLIQWVQLYSIDKVTLRIMFRTLQSVFPYAKLYQVGTADIAIVASPQPLKWKRVKERFFDPTLKAYHKAMGLHQPEDLILNQVFSENIFSQIAKDPRFSLHTLTAPKLAYRGDKTRFTGNTVKPANLAPDYLFDNPEWEDRKIKAFKKYDSMKEQDILKNCVKETSWFCRVFVEHKKIKTGFENKKQNMVARFNNYNQLRRRGLIKHDALFLEKLKSYLIEKKINNNQMIWLYLNHLLSQQEFGKALADLHLFKGKDLLPGQSFEIYKEHIALKSKTGLNPY